MTTEPGIFGGPDRLEYRVAIGRVMRLGAPHLLGVGDLDRVRRALASREVQLAQSLVDYLHTLYIGLLESYAEWALTWPAFVSERRSEHDALRAAEGAYAVWSASLLVNAEYNDKTIELFKGLLDPQSLPAHLAQLATWNSTENQLTIAYTICEQPIQEYRTVSSDLAKGDVEAALERFEQYAAGVRHRHDLLAKYVYAYASAVYRLWGQSFTEEGLQASLSHCTYYDLFWDQLARLTPAEVAAVVAEELRIHGSGAGRRGIVQITEEEDCYHVVFDPCGSGGVMRREIAAAKLEGFAILELVSPSTWGRAGQVPAYCAHCAQNELKALRSLGYPLWVTEFNPDPTKPCGWTIYKSPNQIPTEYLTRLGFSHNFIVKSDQD